MKKKIFYAIITAVIAIVIAAVYITIYQSNYRKGIREWIKDYNLQVAEYNMAATEKNRTTNRLKELQLLELIPEEIANDKDIRNISKKIEEYKFSNNSIMVENGTKADYIEDIEF